MLIYLLLVSLLLILTLKSLRKSTCCTNNFSKTTTFLLLTNYVFNCIFAFCAIVVAVRDVFVGTDTILYSRIYNKIILNNFDFNLSPTPAFIYYCVNYFLGIFFSDSLSIRVFQSVVTYYCFYKIIVKSSEYKFFSLLLFIGFGYFAQSMNISRQMMSIALVLYSAHLLYVDKRISLAIIFWVCAILIHITSAIALTIPLFYCMLKKLKSNCYVFLSCTFLALFVNLIFKYVVFIIAEYVEHYEAYVGSKAKYNILATNTSGVVAYLFLLYLAIIAIYVFKRPNISKVKNQFMQVVFPFVIFLIFCTVFSLLNPFNEMIFRLMLPSYVLLSLIVIPHISSVLSLKEKVIYMPVILVATIFHFYYILFVINCGEVVPYAFYSISIND